MSEFALSKVALLVRIDIRCWTGERVDREASDETAVNHGADRESLKATKRLLGKEHKRLQSIQTGCAAARKALKESSHPWAPGYVLIPVQEWEAFGKKAEMLRQGLQQQWDEFLKVWADIRENSRSSLGTLWKEDDYPSVSALRSRFHFSVTLLPVPEVNQFDGMFQLDVVEERIKRDLARHLEEATNAARDASRGRLISRLVGDDDSPGVISRLENYTGKRGGSFRNATVDRTVELCDTLDRLNVFRDTTLEDWCKRCRDALSNGGDALRGSEELRRQAVDALRQIALEAGEIVPDAPEDVAVDSSPETVNAEPEIVAPSVSVKPAPAVDYDAALAELL